MWCSFKTNIDNYGKLMGKCFGRAGEVILTVFFVLLIYAGMIGY